MKQSLVLASAAVLLGGALACTQLVACGSSSTGDTGDDGGLDAFTQQFDSAPQQLDSQTTTTQKDGGTTGNEASTTPDAAEDTSTVITDSSTDTT